MGSSKKTTTSNSTSTATTTPNAPGYVGNAVQNYYDQVGNFGGALAANPNLLTNPVNSLQQQAYNGATGLGLGGSLADSTNIAKQVAGSGAPQIDPVTQVAATGVDVANLPPAVLAQLTQANAAQAGPAASLLDNFAAYRNVGLDDLVNTNLAAYDDAAGRNTAAANNALAKTGAFGGSRAAIAQSQLAADQALGRGGLAAQLNYDAFGQQAGLANADAGRRQETSLFNTGNLQQTNLANAAAANNNSQFNAGSQNSQAQAQGSLQQQANSQRAQIAAAAAQANAAASNNRASQQAGLNAGQLDRMLSAGGLLSSNNAAERDNLLAQLSIGNSMYDTQGQQNLGQVQGLAALQSLLDPSTYQALVGQTIKGSENGTATEKSSGGLLGKLASVAQIAGTVASLSDRRLKTDIRRVGQTDAGLPIYTYRYKGDDTPQMGVMAQEVEKQQPRALGPEIGGFKSVLYREIR